MGQFVKTLLAFLFALSSVSFAIMVFSGGAYFWQRRFGGPDSLLANEMAFYASQGFRAGAYLKEQWPDKQILLLADPGFQENENVKQLAYAMIEGYGSSDVVLDTIELDEDINDLPMPLYMTMTAADFDATIERHPDAAIVVSTVGLPSDVEKLNFMNTGHAPVVMLLGLPSGPIRGLPEMIESGQIAGVVISNPEAKYDVPAPRDRKEAFGIRYVLVTKENLAENRKHFID